MVQNWENFMSPSGGSTDVGIMNDPLTSLAAGVAIDMFIRPQVDVAYKDTKSAYSTRLKEIRRQRLEKYSKKIEDAHTAQAKLDPRFRKHVASEARMGASGDMSRLKAKFAPKQAAKLSSIRNTGRLLRGASWMLLASGFAMTAESLAMPGLTKSAQESNEMGMGGAGPLDSQQAYTQRQRALMAIHDSQLGLRNVIGNEAGHFHR